MLDWFRIGRICTLATNGGITPLGQPPQPWVDTILITLSLR